jgi:hypothetical protein
MTESDCAAVAAGTQQHWTRAALDEVEIVAEYYGSDEISFACITDPNSSLITGIKIFEGQEISPAHVSVTGRSRIRARREVSREGGVIRLEGHTHGVDGVLFSSGLDIDRVKKIADGGTGFRRHRTTKAEGRLRRVDRAPDVAKGRDHDGLEQ